MLNENSQDIPIREVVVIGAGFVGLAVSAALSTYSIDFEILEQGESIASFWKNGYPSLKMHTPFHGNPHDNNLSEEKYEMFKSKDSVVDYLSEYSKIYDLDKKIQLNTKVEKVNYSEEEKCWEIIKSNGEISKSRYLVVATGLNALPNSPTFLHENIFAGEIKHVWEIKYNNLFQNKKVLIIGSGNSSAEMVSQAFNNGAISVDMLVDSPRYFIKKCVIEYYTLIERKVYNFLNLGNMADSIHDLHHIKIGSLQWKNLNVNEERFLRFFSSDLSPNNIPFPTPLQEGETIYERRAVIDIGSIDLIQKKCINVISGKIHSFTKSGVIIKQKDETMLEKKFDVVIKGTGFKHNLSEFIQNFNSYLGEKKNENNKVLRSKYMNQNDKKLLLDDSSRSLVNPFIYFVGFDSRRNTMTLGNQGFDAGIEISKNLNKFDENIKPKGFVKRKDKTFSLAISVFSFGIIFSACYTAFFQKKKKGNFRILKRNMMIDKFRK